MIIEKIKSLFSSRSTEQKDKSKIKGTVSHIYHKKGYAFISSPEADSNVFVHFNDTVSKIRIGSKVKFHLRDTEKGPRATEVEVIR